MNTGYFPINSDTANGVIVSSQPDRRVSRFHPITCRSSWVNADMRHVWEAQPAHDLSFFSFCCCTCQTTRGPHQIPNTQKRKQDGGEIIKNEDETAEAGETGIRVPRLAPGIWQHRQQKSLQTQEGKKNASIQEKFVCQTLTCCCLSNWVFITVSGEPCY